MCYAEAMASSSGTLGKKQAHARAHRRHGRASHPRAGFNGVGVAGHHERGRPSRHGGFYAHFESRETRWSARPSIAPGRGQRGTARQERFPAPGARGGAFQAFVERYLSERALGLARKSGCPVAALASEIPRQSREVSLAAAQARARPRRRRARRAARRHPAGSRRRHCGAARRRLAARARALGDNAEGKALLAATRRCAARPARSAPSR
jgi:hypothetical protein